MASAKTGMPVEPFSKTGVTCRPDLKTDRKAMGVARTRGQQLIACKCWLYAILLQGRVDRAEECWQTPMWAGELL
jgi:hypothetical protein